MKAFTLGSSLVALAAADAPDYTAMWLKYKADYNKDYSKNGHDEQQRFEIFKTNVDIVEEHNAKKLSWELGINEFADLTAEEFFNDHLGYNAEAGRLGTKVPFPNITDVADSVNWVAKGAVTPVKNQQRCGSCWAFSSTGALEGAFKIAGNSLTSLSEEDLVQCNSVTDHGCQGGLMDNAFNWVEKNGICSESAYPYTSGGGVTGTCKKGCSPVMTVTGHTDVPSKDENALKAAVSKQPVSVAIEADKSAFQLYKSGILDNSACGTNLDHGVLVVGYGTEGKDYWMVKNSWGASWGEKGYIRMVRGKNQCGISQQPSYPTGAKKSSLAAADEPDYAGMWIKFKSDYNKDYSGNGEDEQTRFEIFKKNVDIVEEHNAKKLSYWLGVNEFADQTSEEFFSSHLGYKGEKAERESEKTRLGAMVPFPNITDVADSIDWVAKGAVTPVKNQQRCGSCWAFSSTGALEGAFKIAGNPLTSLSEEDLVQCNSVTDHGCQGGLMDNAFNWVQKNGICSESAYPYTSGGGVTGTCKKGCSTVMTVTGHTDVPSKDENALKAAVSQQPVSVAIEADKSAFQLYKGGVLDNSACGTNLDHGVLVVGYGTDGKDYWKVKNSWGASWGEKGYIRMVRNKNQCGIAQEPSYPTGAKKSAAESVVV